MTDEPPISEAAFGLGAFLLMQEIMVALIDRGIISAPDAEFIVEKAEITARTEEAQPLGADAARLLAALREAFRSLPDDETPRPPASPAPRPSGSRQT